jgi:hypothetical protein
MKISELLNEVDPHKFDSDVDYYAAKNALPKPKHHGKQSPGVNPDDEDYFREIFRKKRLAKQKAEREADHDRLATGTNESATQGAISAANVGVGPVYKNKAAKAAKNKDGTVKNALDQKGTNLLTGGSIGKQPFVKR